MVNNVECKKKNIIKKKKPIHFKFIWFQIEFVRESISEVIDFKFIRNMIYRCDKA